MSQTIRQQTSLRSTLTVEAERGLGIRHRPSDARDVACVFNPIPQPHPHQIGGGASGAVVLGIAAAILVVFILAQVMP